MINDKKKRAAFYTLGCKVNQNETDALAALFKEHNYDIVEPEEIADIYIINTCTVTHLADRKSRNFIRRARKNNSQAKVIVMGCYAQMSPETVKKIPGVNLVIGTADKNKIMDWLEELEQINEPLVCVRDIRAQKEFQEIHDQLPVGRTRAYLKVQEGCNQFCSYCIIPYARGPIRSRSLTNTVKQAQKLIVNGYKEIILTGIHLGAYGRELKENISLETLLHELLQINPDVRWRLSSIEPTEVSSELVELMYTYENFCPHLHMPLQSGHNEILKAMNRPYTTEEYENVVAMVRKKIPNICLTTDIMVGFPGETEEHFNAYVKFVETIKFSDLHVFKYSPRKGTPAAAFAGQVTPPEKERRSTILINTAKELAKQYASGFIGEKVRVLVEKQVRDSLWEGHSENYLKVEFSQISNIESVIQKGQIIPVEINEVCDEVCLGKTAF